MTPDYTHLYRELGVAPGCSLDAFRQAYRRYVAMLHPDRPTTSRDAAASHMPLSHLNALYDDAMEFHRRYGRLPGSSQAITQGHSPRAPAADSAVSRTPAHEDAPRQSFAPYVWLLLAVAGASAIALSASQSPQASAVAPSVGKAALQSSSKGGLHTTLTLGMKPDEVLAIQGEPVHRRDENWDYGPSWLRFEKGRLADWYSSPLYRLHTATPTPDESHG